MVASGAPNAPAAADAKGPMAMRGTAAAAVDRERSEPVAAGPGGQRSAPPGQAERAHPAPTAFFAVWCNPVHDAEREALANAQAHLRDGWCGQLAR
jgi:hypothetical protein